MTITKKIFTNGYVLLMPIFVWNIIFTLASKLPPAFNPNNFNNNIPPFILIGENLFRGIIFILPLFMLININKATGKKGLIIYGVGSALYYLSWLMLMYAPNSIWSNSALGFIAPAYTPIIWLVGMSLMADSYCLKIRYAKWHYIVSSVVFSVFHIAHTVLVYMRT